MRAERWSRRAIVAGFGMVTLGAVALSIVDGWRPAGGHGVPWLEWVLRDTPEARVAAYLDSVAAGDRDGALSLWVVPARGGPGTLEALRERRAQVTDELLAGPLRSHRIVEVQWWSTCCEPHRVRDQRGASFARIAVVGEGERRYTVDVRVVEPERSLLDEVARRWAVTDVYPSGEQPLLFRWVETRTGSHSLGAASPPSLRDCGASEELPPVTYDGRGRECVWTAYSSGTPVRWSVTSRTIEGDPVRAILTAQPGFIVVTRDMSADRFSAPTDRRLWAWQCRSLVTRPWATDPSRSFFELTDCSGDGPTTTFP